MAGIDIISDSTGKEIVAAIQSTDVAQARILEINAAAESKKNEVLESIPEDYSNIVNEVAELKGDLVNSSMYEKDNLNIFNNIKEVVVGKYLDMTTGIVQTNSAYSYGYIYDINENDLIALVKSNGFSGWITCYDSSGVFINGFQLTLGSTKKLPVGTTKIGITYKTGNEPIISIAGSGSITNPLGEYVLNQKENVTSNLLNILGYRNRIDDVTSYIDGIFWYNGLTNVNSEFKAQNTICIKGIKTLYARSSSVFVNFYDENLNYISSAGDHSVSVPDNAVFASISCNKNTSVVCDLSLLDDDFYYVNNEIQNLENYVAFKSYELLDKSKMTDGKYVDCTTGSIADLSSFTTSDFIRVIPNLEYIVSGGISASQVAFYDMNKSYISGIVTNENSFTIPNDVNITYMRWCTGLALKNKASIKLKSILDQNKLITVHNGESILEGVISAYSKGIKKIVVEDGTYDIISEYKSHFGNDCFDNYSSADDYNFALMGVYGRGIWLEDIEIIFSPSAKVIAHYDGLNSSVVAKFSPFATGNNVTIDGLHLDSKNLRYGIHADYNTGNDLTTFTVKNCDLKHLNENGFQQCIGAGLGVHVYWEFSNNIFRSTNSSEVFRIHNNVSDNAKSKIVIKDCYVEGDGFMTVRSYGDSTSMSELFVSNCSWNTPISVVREGGGYIDNIELYAWNNETRSN